MNALLSRHHSAISSLFKIPSSLLLPSVRRINPHRSTNILPHDPPVAKLGSDRNAKLQRDTEAFSCRRRFQLHQGRKLSSRVCPDSNAGAINHILNPAANDSTSVVNTITAAMPSPPTGAQGKHSSTKQSYPHPRPDAPAGRAASTAVISKPRSRPESLQTAMLAGYEHERVWLRAVRQQGGVPYWQTNGRIIEFFYLVFSSLTLLHRLFSWGP